MTTGGDTHSRKEAGCSKARSLLSAAADAAMFVAVLGLTAFAVIAIALAAPVALAISALAGIVAPKRIRSHWRSAQPA